MLCTTMIKVQNNKMNSLTQAINDITIATSKVCDEDEDERPLCEECEEYRMGSAYCNMCDRDFCMMCEDGGDDDTPEQNWVCNDCLEDIAEIAAESTDEDTDDDQSDEDSDDEDKTCHTCKKEYEVEAGRGGYEGHECFECFEKKTTKKKHKKKPRLNIVRFDEREDCWEGRNIGQSHIVSVQCNKCTCSVFDKRYFAATVLEPCSDKNCEGQMRAVWSKDLE